jgi:hypothetical protein
MAQRMADETLSLRRSTAEPAGGEFKHKRRVVLRNFAEMIGRAAPDVEIGVVL